MGEPVTLDDPLSYLKERRQIIILSTFDKWVRAFLMLLSIATLGLLALLLMELSDLETVIAKNRALDCRMLVLDGVELQENGQCFDPDVLRFYDPATGESR